MGAAVNQNLTLEGTEDWAVWGYAQNGTSALFSPHVQKIGGTGISALTNITNGNPLRGLGQFTEGHTFSWSNGTPTLSATGAYGGLEHDGEQPPKASNVGEGFSFLGCPPIRLIKSFGFT